MGLTSRLWRSLLAHRDDENVWKKLAIILEKQGMKISGREKKCNASIITKINSKARKRSIVTSLADAKTLHALF